MHTAMPEPMSTPRGNGGCGAKERAMKNTVCAIMVCAFAGACGYSGPHSSTYLPHTAQTKSKKEVLLQRASEIDQEYKACQDKERQLLAEMTEVELRAYERFVNTLSDPNTNEATIALEQRFLQRVLGTEKSEALDSLLTKEVQLWQESLALTDEMKAWAREQAEQEVYAQREALRREAQRQRLAKALREWNENYQRQLDRQNDYANAFNQGMMQRQSNYWQEQRARQEYLQNFWRYSNSPSK